MVSKLVTWQPTQGIRSKGCPKKTYVNLHEDETAIHSTVYEASRRHVFGKPLSLPESKHRRSECE